MDDTSFDVTCIVPPGSVQRVDELRSGPFAGIVLLTIKFIGQMCLLPSSLVPRPHPLTRKGVW